MARKISLDWLDDSPEKQTPLRPNHSNDPRFSVLGAAEPSTTPMQPPPSASSSRNGFKTSATDSALTGNPSHNRPFNFGTSTNNGNNLFNASTTTSNFNFNNKTDSNSLFHLAAPKDPSRLRQETHAPTFGDSISGNANMKTATARKPGSFGLLFEEEDEEDDEGQDMEEDDAYGEEDDGQGQQHFFQQTAHQPYHQQQPHFSNTLNFNPQNSLSYSFGHQQLGLGGYDSASSRYHVESDSAEMRMIEAEVQELVAQDVLATENAEFLAALNKSEEGEDDGEGENEDDQDDLRNDMFLSVRLGPTDDEDAASDAYSSESNNLLEFTTPAADARIKKDAEALLRVSRRSIQTRKRGFQYSAPAHAISEELGIAHLDEELHVIEDTEKLVTQLYQEGIREIEDATVLDAAISTIAGELSQLWQNHAKTLPDPEDDEPVTTAIGPGPNADPFKKAEFVADLLLRIHHSKTVDSLNQPQSIPFPAVLFQWLRERSPERLRELRSIRNHGASPAAHNHYWPTVSLFLIRGEIHEALDLLRNGGWSRSPEYVTSPHIVQNIEQAIQETCQMLSQCPAVDGNWDIASSHWALFRHQARASWDKLSRFVENKSRSQLGVNELRNNTLAHMSRQAESVIPWFIYECLNSIYDIVLGNKKAIVESAEDWCEATIGLVGWWDADASTHDHNRSQFQKSTLSISAPIVRASAGSPLDRLAFALHVVLDGDLTLDSTDGVEVAVASILEGNYAAGIHILRGWSLPLASSVSEIATLGKWIPEPERVNPLTLGEFDDEDLATLGVSKPSLEDVEGVLDSTLSYYARALAAIAEFPDGRPGWEVALNVLGRMDSIRRSEEMASELVRDLLDSFDTDSSEDVQTVWRVLVDLDMQSFAEEAAEAYANLLRDNSQKYGEAIWYYALAHKTDRVREILNLLTSYSLIFSAPFPPTSELDEHLKNLLTDRSTTLERYAKQDVKAADLVGKMLSGYATLRKYYELRDSALSESGSLSKNKSLTTVSAAHSSSVAAPKTILSLSPSRRRQAASALIAVIASADNRIRGGLYDESCESIVLEDFLLVLLGEALVLLQQDPASIISLDQMNVLLKAVEDLESLSGSMVYESCELFFRVVVAFSSKPLQGASPADLMQSATQTDGSSSSVILSGTSKLVSQLRQALHPTSSASKTAGRYRDVPRGWDWRSGLTASMTAKDVLQILRLGLSRDLAKLWLQEADHGVFF